MTDDTLRRFGERPGIYHKIVRKLERAIRHGTSCNLTHEQLVAILRTPAWMLLAERERADLLAQYDQEDAPVLAKPKRAVSTSKPPGAPYSIRTLAERWSCSEGLVRKLIRSGELQSFR